ncbi:hypothetical protein [Agarivorans sp. Alg241-V36]|uniref:hypothetical protein n=1 Tax=Agarivorans sp. Alg241-V36 TaxID=2305992 RepID=UPI0013D6B1E6|nr:hypothetical protein [Agarivorans sp. Alg241-V36]
MKLRLLAITLLSFNIQAEILDTITDTFSISFGSDTTATLNASYDLNDSWRVFGEVDTEGYGEFGFGYSFLTGSVYHEIAGYVSSPGQLSEFSVKPWLGYFVAGYVTDSTVLYGSLDLGYDQAEPINTVHKTNVDTSLGLVQEVTDWLSFGYEFSHYHSFHVAKHWGNKGSMNTHEVSAMFNIKGVKPTIRYHISEDFDNYVELGLSFDF